MKSITIYLIPVALFFVVEVFSHGNELIPLAGIIAYTLVLYTWSKERRRETVLFMIAMAIGLIIELALPFINRAQVWQNASYSPIPLWLPLAWGVGGVLFYRLGNAIK